MAPRGFGACIVRCKRVWLNTVLCWGWVFWLAWFGASGFGSTLFGVGVFPGGILAPRGFGLAWFGASGFGSTRFGVGFFPGLHWDVQGFVGPMDSRGVYAGRLCLRYLFQ